MDDPDAIGESMFANVATRLFDSIVIDIYANAAKRGNELAEITSNPPAPTARSGTTFTPRDLISCTIQGYVAPCALSTGVSKEKALSNEVTSLAFLAPQCWNELFQPTKRSRPSCPSNLRGAS